MFIFINNYLGMKKGVVTSCMLYINWIMGLTSSSLPSISRLERGLPLLVKQLPKYFCCLGILCLVFIQSVG